MTIYKGPIRQQKRITDKNFLIVDDIAQMREMIRIMLKNNGYGNVTSAESGNQAWRYMKTHPVDFVITDWSMPNMPGVELLKQIKTDPKYFSIPVIMISDERASDKVLYAVEEGADGFLVKPFSENALIKYIKQILAKTNSDDETEKKIVEMRRLKLSKKYSEALSLGFEILKVRNHQRVVLMTCECLYQVEEYDKAIAMMADTEDDRKSGQQCNLLGKIYLNLGQYSQGIQVLEQAVRLNPLNNDRKIDLAGAYFAAGKKEEGEKVIQGIVNFNPTDLNLVNIAQIYLDQEDLEKAGQYLKQTVDPIKETVHIFNNYAVALRRAERFEEATEVYMKCLKIDPDSDVLYYNTAVLYAKIGKLNEAREALSNAVRLNPDNHYAKDLLQKISSRAQ
jgi:two-component system chemotaxis response regulator CheY